MLNEEGTWSYSVPQDVDLRNMEVALVLSPSSLQAHTQSIPCV